jgi:hypothetical protein
MAATKSTKSTSRKKSSAERQLRFAIERVLTDHPDTPTLQAIEGALYSAVEDWWGVVAH